MPTAYFAVIYLTSDPDQRVPLTAADSWSIIVLDRDLKSVYLAVLGVSVAGDFAALTTIRGSSAALRRLRLVGLRARHLLTARLLVLLAITVASTLVFLAIFLPLMGHQSAIFSALAMVRGRTARRRAGARCWACCSAGSSSRQ